MRRLGNILIVVIAIAALYGMQRTKPRFDALTAPIVVQGKMNVPVHSREFDVTVDQVAFARELAFVQFGQKKSLTTSGLWAVVTAHMAATTSSTVVSSAMWLGPTGLKYNLTRRVGWGAGMPPVELAPGMPQQVQLVFEILPDQVNGATLMLSGKPDPVLDSEAHIAIDNFKKFNDGQPQVFQILNPLQPAAGS